jgi:4-amino-4-deoxy-L-arabinose transferase-like glycosyltransferase
MAVAACATFFIGRRLWSARVGMVAMVIVPLTPLSLVEGIAATTDAVLLGLVTAGIAVVASMLYRPPRWIDAIFLGGLLGLATLAKGPVGLVLPVGIAGAGFWLARREVAWNRRFIIHLAAAAAIGTAIFAAWLIPASQATGGRVAHRTLITEGVQRALEPMEGHGTPLLLSPFYYLVVVTIGFAPWILGLPSGVRRVFARTSWRSRSGALIAAWMAVPFVAFTIAATKLPHYIMPIWPALALIVAVALDDYYLRVSARVTRMANVAVCGSVVLAIALLLGARAIERFKPVPAIAAIVRESNAPGPLFVYEFEEPSLTFYGRRSVITLYGARALVEWRNAQGEALLVAPRSAVDAVERWHGPLGLREIAARRGWNYVKGERLELVAFVRPSVR